MQPGFGYGNPILPLNVNLLDAAFKFLRNNFGICVVCSLFELVLSVVATIPCVVLELQVIAGMQNRSELSPITIVGFFFAWLFAVAMHGTILSGWSIHMRQVWLGAPLNPTGMLTAPRNWGSVIVTSFLASLVIVFGFYLFIAPGLYLMGRLCMAPTLASEFGLSPVQALSESWRRSAKDAWLIGGVLFLAYLVASLGSIACGIGIIATLPILPITVALVSLAVVPPPGDRTQPGFLPSPPN